MEQPKDYYHVLGLMPDTSQDEVKRAYRRLAMQHHPDRNRDDPHSEDKLKEINEAYRILGDPVKRWAYDQIRIPHAQAHPFMSSRFVHIDLETLLQRFTGWDREILRHRFCKKRGFGRGRCWRR
jgi:DnaJ-class molecular chaperone